MNIRGTVDFAREVVEEWQADQAQMLGAALAYYSVFSIGPLLLIAITIAGVFVGKASVQTQVFKQLSTVIGPDGAQTVSLLLGHAFKAGSGLLATVVAIGSLIFAASGIFSQMRTSLNLILEAPPPPNKGIWSMVLNQLTAIVMVAAMGAILLGTMLLSTALMVLNTHLSAVIPIATPLWYIPQLLVTYAAVTTLFVLMYKYLSYVEVPWRQAWKAAAITAALFTVGEFAISAYLGVSAPGSMYGAAGSLLVVLVWVYYSAQVFFLGVELIKVGARRGAEGVTLLREPGATLAEPTGGRRSISSAWTRKHPSSRG
jgi:membrane protein